MPAIYTAGVTDAPALNSSTELKLQIFFNNQSDVYNTQVFVFLRQPDVICPVVCACGQWFHNPLIWEVLCQSRPDFDRCKLPYM